MRKKLKSEAGFTLVEMLVTTVVMVLLGLMLNVGLQMAVRSYRAVTAQSEAELLLSTAVDALADDLRFARMYEAADSGDGVPFTYFSDSYGENTHLTLDGETGQIMAGGKRVLPTGAYGLEGADGKRAYEVTRMTIMPNLAENTFTIALTVAATIDGGISASTPEGGVTVRCLNKMNGMETEGGS